MECLVELGFFGIRHVKSTVSCTKLTTKLEFYETVQGSLTVTPRSFPNNEFNDHFLSLHPLDFSNPWFGEYWKSVNLTSQSLSPETASLGTSMVTSAMDVVYAFTHTIHKLLQKDYCGGGPAMDCVRK